MKKKIFGAVVVVAIAVGTMVNVNLNKVGNHTGDLALANVEALAQSEGVTVTCGATQGQCWVQGHNLRICGEYMYYECVRGDDPKYSCYNPC